MRPTPGSGFDPATQGLAAFSQRNVYFRKAVASQPQKAPASGDVRTYMGMDPEGLQRAGTDPVEIAIKEYNGEAWESRAEIAMRSGGNVADAYVSGFFQAGEAVLSSPGLIWEDSSHTFAGIIGIALAADAGSVVAVMYDTATSAEIGVSTDGGATFGSPVANPASHDPTCAEFGNGVLLVAGYAGMLIRSTTHGASFDIAEIANGFATAGDIIYDLAYDSDAGIWCMVGQSTTLVLLSADDGATWYAPTTLPSSGGLFNVVYVGNNTFVAKDQLDANVYISTDSGDNWGSGISVDTGATGGYLVFGNGVLAALIHISGNFALYRSLDRGNTWTENTDYTHTPGDYGASFGGNLFMIGGQISSDGARTFQGLNVAECDFAVYDEINRTFVVGNENATDLHYSGWLEAGAGIVEHGSNANGEYIRFSDGTQVCRYTDTTERTTDTAAGAVYRDAVAGSFTFATAFLLGTVPEVSFTVVRSSGVVWVGSNGGSPDATTVGVRLLGTTNSATGYVGYIAIGRWK